MTDVEYTVGTEGSRVFVPSRGDYRQGDVVYRFPLPASGEQDYWFAC